MKISLFLFTLTAFCVFGAEAEPEKGIYEFESSHEVTQCKSVGPMGDCLKKRVTKFIKGQMINSDRAFFDDKKMAWDIGIVLHGQNISLPVNKCKYLGPADCKRLKKKYLFDINLLDKLCKIDTDCKGFSLRYDSCASEFPISKSVKIETLKAHEAELFQVRKKCKYLAPPCKRYLKPIFCKSGLCSEKVE